MVQYKFRINKSECWFWKEYLDFSVSVYWRLAVDMGFVLYFLRISALILILCILRDKKGLIPEMYDLSCEDFEHIDFFDVFKIKTKIYDVSCDYLK